MMLPEWIGSGSALGRRGLDGRVAGGLLSVQERGPGGGGQKVEGQAGDAGRGRFGVALTRRGKLAPPRIWFRWFGSDR